MTKTILLLGRKNIIVSDAQSQLHDLDLQIYTGTNIDDVRSIFSQAPGIDHVFMGAGIELETRLEIVREGFTLSANITVHLKDASSGPQGFLPFVKAVLGELKGGGL
jgi:hypothetical protein